MCSPSSQSASDRADGRGLGLRNQWIQLAASVLVGLESEVAKLLQGIRRGIAMLDDRQPVPMDLVEADEDQEAAV